MFAEFLVPSVHDNFDEANHYVVIRFKNEEEFNAADSDIFDNFGEFVNNCLPPGWIIDDSVELVCTYGCKKDTIDKNRGPLKNRIDKFIDYKPIQSAS